MALEGLTYAEFDFQVVANLVGNFTRPVSIRLAPEALSERGVLFESYVNAVLVPARDRQEGCLRALARPRAQH